MQNIFRILDLKWIVVIVIIYKSTENYLDVQVI